MLCIVICAMHRQVTIKKNFYYIIFLHTTHLFASIVIGVIVTGIGCCLFVTKSLHELMITKFMLGT